MLVWEEEIEMSENVPVKCWEKAILWVFYTQSHQVTWQTSFKSQANWSQFEFTLTQANDSFLNPTFMIPNNYGFVLPHVNLQNSLESKISDLVTGIHKQTHLHIGRVGDGVAVII